MAKGIAWNKIKAEYLQGVTPKELAEKYKIEIEKLYKKIENDKWAAELREIKGKIGNEVQEQIKVLTNLALEALKNVIKDGESKPADIVAASRAILDVSGLKSLKQELSGTLTAPTVIIDHEVVEVERD